MCWPTPDTGPDNSAGKPAALMHGIFVNVGG